MEIKEKQKLNTWLNDYSHTVTSQAGEDGIIAKILEVISQHTTCDRWCCEFGSWDGMHLSNTYNLIENQGYSAIFIEGDKKRFKTLHANFKNKENIQLLQRLCRI